MIEINIWKILLVLLVALLVLGPKHLSEIAFKLGTFLKKMRTTVDLAQRELKAIAMDNKEPTDKK